MCSPRLECFRPPNNISCLIKRTPDHETSVFVVLYTKCVHCFPWQSSHLGYVCMTLLLCAFTSSGIAVPRHVFSHFLFIFIKYRPYLPSSSLLYPTPQKVSVNTHALWLNAPSVRDQHMYCVFLCCFFFIFVRCFVITVLQLFYVLSVFVCHAVIELLIYYYFVWFIYFVNAFCFRHRVCHIVRHKCICTSLINNKK